MQGLGRAAILPMAALGLLAWAMPGASGAAAKADSGTPSQCRAGEATLYSCRFGRSVGSVCAGGSKVHYRFGPLGRPDLDLASADDWSNVRVGRVVGQGGGHQSHVRFTNGRHHYIVFEGTDGALADSPGRSYSGIHVAAGADGSEPLADLRCRGRATLPEGLSAAVVDRAPPRLRDGDALWEEEGGPFDGWF